MMESIYKGVIRTRAADYQKQLDAVVIPKRCMAIVDHGGVLVGVAHDADGLEAAIAGYQRELESVRVGLPPELHVTVVPMVPHPGW